MKLWSVSSIKVCIKNKKIKLKGFTLIEVLLASALIGIVTSMCMLAASKYSKIFAQEMKLAKESFYVNQAFIIIEKEINDAEEIKIKNNEIILKRSKVKCWDCIRADKDSDIIIAYGGMSPYTANNILKNIKNFNLYDKQGVVYICIQMNSQKKYERCLNLQLKRSLEDLY